MASFDDMPTVAPSKTIGRGYNGYNNFWFLAKYLIVIYIYISMYMDRDIPLIISP